MDDSTETGGSLSDFFATGNKIVSIEIRTARPGDEVEIHELHMRSIREVNLSKLCKLKIRSSTLKADLSSSRLAVRGGG